MKKKLFQAYLFLTVFGLILMTPIDRVSAQTSWNLQVSNIANNKVNYNYDQILAMPETTVSASEYCYGGLVSSGDWGGVSLSYLLEQAGLDPTVASVNFLAQDGYAVSLQIQEAQQSDVIIAYQLNGAALPETLRLVIPEENGNIWIAMITSITMSISIVSSASGGGGPGEVPTQTTPVPSISPTPPPKTTPTPTLPPISSPSASPTLSPISSSSSLPVTVDLAAVAVVIVITLFLIVFRKSRHKAI